jgi:hypothetical protein
MKMWAVDRSIHRINGKPFCERREGAGASESNDDTEPACGMRQLIRVTAKLPSLNEVGILAKRGGPHFGSMRSNPYHP